MSRGNSTSSARSDSTSEHPWSTALRAGLRPEPRLTVSAWADAHRMLSGPAPPEPGRWRTSRTPYLREPFDCLSATSLVRRVVIQKSAQLGCTEASVNWLGYLLADAPRPSLHVQAT